LEEEEEDLTLESDTEQDNDVDDEMTDIAERNSGINEVSNVCFSDGDSIHIAHYLGSDYLNLTVNIPSSIWWHC
jgi:hypothetical protein